MTDCRACPERAEWIARTEKATLDKNALLEEVTSLTRRLAAAKAELTKQRTEHPLAGAVQGWLEYWRFHLSTVKSDISPGGDRWARALKAMTRKVEHAQRLNEDDPVEWALAELKLAVDGNKQSAFHQGGNDRRKRYADVKHVLKDEETTDGFIELAKGEVVLAPVPERPNEALRELRARFEQRGEALEECFRQLRTYKWLVPLLREMVADAAEHNAVLEAEVARLRGEERSEAMEMAA